MDCKKIPTSYIGIMVPPLLQQSFETIRKKYMPYFSSGPHVTLVDPFLEYKHFGKASAMIEESLQSFSPFEIRFQRFSFFQQKKGCGMFFLEAETTNHELEEIQQRIVNIYPQCNDLSKNYHPHLSMGQLKSEQETIDKLKELEAEWVPVSFEVKEIYLLTKVGKNPYQIRKVIPLGKTESKPYFQEIPE